jgi:AcrR family transcriptional regulator
MAKSAKASPRVDIATRKQAFVRDEIESSAAGLFAERGFRAVTMDDIADSLGYTKSVLYYYFKNKNEILWLIFSRSLDIYASAIDAILRKGHPHDIAMREMIREHAMCVMRNKNYTTIYNREESELTDQQQRLLNKRRRDYDQKFEMVYKSGIEKGMFRDIPPHVAISGILGMCNWLHVWYDERGPLSAEQIAGYYATLLSSGYMTG